MSTKTYSSRQEGLIADWLGWELVPASGARNFHPGDLRSSEWLGECKTHVNPTQHIKFSKDVWNKIIEESSAEFKYPVLFVDNGTQTLTGCWCMFNHHLYKKDFNYFIVNSENYMDLNRLIKLSQSSISFHHVELLNAYKKLRSTNVSCGITDHLVIDLGKFGNMNCCICPLTEFVDMFSMR